MQRAAVAAGWNNYTFAVVLCTKCRLLLVFCSASSSPQISHLKESDGKMGGINVVCNAVVLTEINRTVCGHQNRFISQKCVGWAHHDTVSYCGGVPSFLSPLDPTSSSSIRWHHHNDESLALNTTPSIHQSVNRRALRRRETCGIFMQMSREQELFGELVVDKLGLIAAGVPATELLHLCLWHFTWENTTKQKRTTLPTPGFVNN